MTGQDMTWRAEQSARIERELITRGTPDLCAQGPDLYTRGPELAAQCGGDCGDCNGCDGNEEQDR